MVRSRLPLLSLLGLFGALLMLFLGTPEDLCDLPVTDPGVEKALTFALVQYNRFRRKDANYFKVLRVLKAQSQVETRYEYHLTVELVETTCEKSACCKLSYKDIQMCEQFPGNQEKQTCYLKVIHRLPVNFKIVSCT
ncbi:cystatin-like [Pantherophis guttatus]|uniref:Cystatin-like n=1 Tax=Pantherophis guttatus TaxID=94885 RepID=A0ABM3YR77_PANGU|nr:cystatin-like [Pantherophis guttatus]